MARFRLCLLGPFQALLAGKPITGFESNKTRALLAYLATENSRPHGREFLAELLWPERPQGVALADLRHTLADLRSAIGDHAAPQPCLLTDHQTLQFDPTSLEQGDAFVDVTRFAALLGLGTGASLAAYREAVNLYGGQFLQGFALDGSPEFEAWLVLQRERCNYQVTQALAQLIRHGVEQGDYAQAAHWAQRLLELDPWNEDVHRQLMWLLAASGARAAALRQYDACVRVLDAEFGVEPQGVTHILADRIRTDEGDLGACPGTIDAQGEPRPVGVDGRARGAHNLPLEATPLVGRTRELAEITQTLTAPTCRLLTIVGPGGIGKTRLAVESARRAAPHFRDGAWFVDLAPADGVAGLPTVLLRRLAAPESGAADATRRLLAYLAPKQMLLVLDNFEHLLDGSLLVVEMLAAAPALKVLVTSRARLNLRDEWLHPLAGLEAPPASAGANNMTAAAPQAGEQGDCDLAAFDATRLFLQCVRRLEPGFAPDTQETQLIAEICRRLEGMPLAIELAAAWIRRLPLHNLAVEVAGGLQQLETPLRDMPPRHRSMTAVFGRSWQLLTACERAIMCGMSVFRGGATQDAAAEVAGAAREDLGRLVDASWLRLGKDGRYEIHELVRQYCSARLAEGAPRGESSDEVRQRHCTWYGRFLREQTQRVNYHQEVTAVLLAEFGNLQAAWQWGVEHGQMEMARDMALSLYYIGDMLGRYHFAIQAYAPIIATLETIIDNPATPPAECSGARVVLGWLEYAQVTQSLDLGLIEQARVAVQRCQAAARGLAEGDARRELLLLSEWGRTCTMLAAGSIEEARTRGAAFIRELEDSATDYTLYGRELGRKFWLAHAYAHRARCDWFQANYVEAEDLMQRAIALRDGMGEQRFCAFNLAEYAKICITVGKAAAAVDLARRGLGYSQAFGDQIGIASGRLALGMALAAQGQWAVAAAYLQQSLAMGRQSGHRFLHVSSAVHLGRVLLARGENDKAQLHFEEALDAAIRNGGVPYVHLATVLNSLGMAAQARGDGEPAAQYHRQALQQSPHCPAWEVQDAWYGLAQVCLAQGDQVQAQALFEEVACDRATSAATRCAAERQLHFL